MKHLNWLKIQTYYPTPNFWKRGEKRDFRKKKKKKKKKKIDKTIRASGLKSESILPITIFHNQLDLWYGIIHTF